MKNHPASPLPPSRAALVALCLGALLPVTASGADSPFAKIDARPRVSDRETHRAGVHRKVEITEKTTALLTRIENLTFEPLPPGKVTYTLQFERKGALREAKRSRSGSEPIPAIQGRGKFEIELGGVPLLSSNVTDRADEISGWHVRIELEDGRSAEAASPGFKPAGAPPKPER